MIAALALLLLAAATPAPQTSASSAHAASAQPATTPTPVAVPLPSPLAAARGPWKAVARTVSERDGSTRVHVQVARSATPRLDRTLPDDYTDERIVGLAFLDLGPVDHAYLGLDLYSGGAHCCTTTLVYDFAPSGPPRLATHDWGNGGYRLEHVGGRQPLFLTRDDAFAYAFTSYADSAYPIALWEYRGGTFVDVTREYPARVEADAARLWSAVQDQAQTRSDASKAILVAYLADMLMLKKADAAVAKIDPLLAPSDRDAFYATATDFLRKTHYLAADGSLPRPPQNG